ncbi:MAG: ATP-binding protein [Acidimicrobiales bacterium]
MEVSATTRFRGEPAAVPAARAVVGQALRSAGVTGDEREQLVLAVAEACNNAILHAGGETFTVAVAVNETRCTITISDGGQGFYPPRRALMPSPDAVGHRGLALMQELVDHVTVSSSPAGTTVVLVQELTSDRDRSPPLVVEL